MNVCEDFVCSTSQRRVAETFSKLSVRNWWSMYDGVIDFVCMCVVCAKDCNKRQTVLNLVISLGLALRQCAWEARQTSWGWEQLFPVSALLPSFFYSCFVHWSCQLSLTPPFQHESFFFCWLHNCLLAVRWQMSVSHMPYPIVPYPTVCCPDLLYRNCIWNISMIYLMADWLWFSLDLDLN